MEKVIQKPAPILYPGPVVLVSCGTGQRANIITLGLVSTLCLKPLLMGIGVRPSRYSHRLIKEAGEFVINVPDAEQIEWVDHCGIASGRDDDKWAACGFTPAPAAEVQVPLIAECPINIECRLQQTLSLGSHDFFIGEVLAVQVDEAMLDEGDRPDSAKARLLVLLGREYWQIGQRLGIVKRYAKK